ncbi:hypothetical protein D7D52_27715 [Nocardia yunnanensis]|uniref:Uncharacterized protein n=1 Tax=Nocardia yunnanensis TaxID=2382165 RepID=A0A386ZID3_9NOCA|nr:hypothetical protein [Nocardia yunnanensis]AYF76963.1 hypothetical protein D7D52_27715 [Nocardia yunnanensis]
MVTTRIQRRAIAFATAVAACTAAVSLAAAPALAENSLSVESATSSAVAIQYTCEASAGVAGIEAMVGDPNAEAPAATGVQTSVTCDGSQHTATIALTAAAGQPALTSGATVQARVALVDRSETVVSGTAKLLTLD